MKQNGGAYLPAVQPFRPSRRHCEKKHTLRKEEQIWSIKESNIYEEN